MGSLLTILALQAFAVEYRLALEFRCPVQLDEYSAAVDWVQGDGG